MEEAVEQVLVVKAYALGVCPVVVDAALAHVVGAPPVEVDEQHAGIKVAVGLGVAQHFVACVVVGRCVDHGGYGGSLHGHLPEWGEGTSDKQVTVEVDDAVQTGWQVVGQPTAVVGNERYVAA